MLIYLPLRKKGAISVFPSHTFCKVVSRSKALTQIITRHHVRSGKRLGLLTTSLPSLVRFFSSRSVYKKLQRIWTGGCSADMRNFSAEAFGKPICPKATIIKKALSVKSVERGARTLAEAAKVRSVVTYALV